MKRLIPFIFIFLSSCQTLKKTENITQPTSYRNLSLSDDLAMILEDVKSSDKLNAESCFTVLPPFLNAITQERLLTLTPLEVTELGSKIMDTSSKIRFAINDRVGDLGVCRNLVRDLIFHTRALEDLLGEKLFGPGRAMSSKEIDFKNGPTPIFDIKEFKGYVAREGYAPGPNYKFQAGDLLLEKGNSFISAMLSNAVNPRGHLSHFALIHIDPNTQKPISIESFIQSGGVAKFEISEALRKYNVRIVVVRPRDHVAAGKMSKIIYDWMEDAQKNGKKIPYDFALDFSDDSQMSCSELVLWGYNKSAGGQVNIPAQYSELSQNMKRILAYVGIKPGKVFTPMDIEVDPNFQILTEFRDYRLMRESRYRDSIFTMLMEWMIGHSYQLVKNPPNLDIAKMIHPMRRSGLPTPRNEKGESEVPQDFTKAIRRLNAVSDLIMRKLRDRDESFQNETGWPMPNARLEAEIELIRLEDKKNFDQGNPATFHHILRPATYWEMIRGVF